MGRIGFLLPVCLLILGCRANEDSIQAFILQAHDTATTEMAPLQEQYVFVADEFVMASPRVPFTRPRPEQEGSAADTNNRCWQPDLKREREVLESYPLAQLSMKGVMGGGKRAWALISTPEGRLMKVGEGDYLGLNYGRVLQVSSQGIEIEEILPDGAGCWLKSAIALTFTSSDSAV